jgi:hypothetical protein
MAQVDFVGYSSILLWFFLFIIIFYILNYSYLIPLIYIALFVRKFYYIWRFLKIKNKFNLFNKHKNNNNSNVKYPVTIKLAKKSSLYA